ncbi:MAG: hypothetical protein IPK26_11400 [Planctomycetes bacterium]|nr:hypothetical protein [Planctomycetota bacterium]
MQPGHCAALVITLSFCNSLLAQALRGGDLLTTDYGSASLHRIDAAGVTTTWWAGAPLAGPAGVTTTQGGDVVVVDFTADRLVRFDRNTGSPTTIATGIGGPLRVCEDADGTFLVTGITPRRLVRVTGNGQVTTVASGAPLVRPFAVSLDLDGSYLVADDFAPGLFRVTAGGVVTPIHVGLPLRLPQGVAVFPNGDYAVIDGITDVVYRIDRGTGMVTVFCPNATLGGNPEGIVPDSGGGFFVAQSGASGSRIAAVDPLGNATTVAAGAPMVNIEDLARVPFLTGPTALGSGPGALFSFPLDLPGHGGEFYTLALSASVFPGWQFPGDARSLALNIDPFFLATTGVDAPPFLAGWAGFLDGNGRANPSSDFRMLPAGVFAGLTFWQQGFTLSGSSVSAVLNVRRLTLQ